MYGAGGRSVSLTPQDDALDKRLTALDAAIDEFERKTLSNLAVTDPITGIKMLTVDQDPANANRPRITVKDSTGNILLLNDTAGTGWGLRAPTYSGNAYLAASFGGSQNTTVTDKISNKMAFPITSQKIMVRYFWEFSFTGSKTGTYAIRWAPWGTTSYTDIVAPFTQTGSGGGSVTPFLDSTYTWPSNMFGQVVEISSWSKLSVAGSNDWTANTIEFVKSLPF